MKKTNSKILSIFLVIVMIMTMSAFTSINVMAADAAPKIPNELVDEAVVKIDYAKETLIAQGSYVFDVADGAPKLAYALNASKTDSSKNASLKWLPIYGDSIDISKIIPKTPSKVGSEKYIAIKTIAQSGVDKDNILGVIEIKGRPDTKDAANNIYGSDKKLKVVYAPATETVAGVSSLFEYRIGSSAWVAISGTSIKAGSAYNPTGATVELRIAAVADTNFASDIVKIKVPAQPKAPTFKVTYTAEKSTTKNGETTTTHAKTVFSGFKKDAKYEIKTDAGVSNFTVAKTATKTEINLANLTESSNDIVLTGAKVTLSGDSKTSYIEIRLAATEKNPYSAWAKVAINIGDDARKATVNTYLKTASGGETSEPAQNAGALDATFAAGTAAGKTKATATVTAETENTLYIVTGGDAAVTGVKVGDTVSNGEAYTSGNDFDGAAGKFVTIYELDSNSKVVKFISHLIDVQEINA